MSDAILFRHHVVAIGVYYTRKLQNLDENIHLEVGVTSVSKNPWIESCLYVVTYCIYYRIQYFVLNLSSQFVSTIIGQFFKALIVRRKYLFRSNLILSVKYLIRYFIYALRFCQIFPLIRIGNETLSKKCHLDII